MLAFDQISEYCGLAKLMHKLTITIPDNSKLSRQYTIRGVGEGTVWTRGKIREGEHANTFVLFRRKMEIVMSLRKY